MSVDNEEKIEDAELRISLTHLIKQVSELHYL